MTTKTKYLPPIPGTPDYKEIPIGKPELCFIRPETLTAQIKSSYFTAGLIIQDDFVTRAAPIIKYMIGWEVSRVKTYCIKKNWEVEFVN